MKIQPAILLAVIALAVGFVGWGIPNNNHDTTSLGTWANMPSAATELMGNTSYRAVLMPGNGFSLSGISAGLAVSCIIKSNTVGANLLLQYALFSLVSQTNTTNFQTITNTQVFIDGTTSPNCTNNSIVFQPGVALNTTTANVGYMFRVLGSGGGGQNDNPRFSWINVLPVQSQTRIYMPTVIASSISLTGFTGRIYTNIPTIASTSVTFQWFATNGNTVQDQSGSSSCTIAIGGTNCNTAVTFGTAFTVTVPNVVMTSGNAGQGSSFPLGSMNLLSAQTLRV